MKLPGAGDVGSQKGRLLPGTFVIMLFKFLQLLIRHSAVLQEPADFLPAQLQRLRLILVFLQTRIEILVNVPDHVIITVLPQSIRDQSVKGLLLTVGGQGDTAAAEHLLDKILLKLRRVFGIVEHAVDIRVPVVKRGEKKSLDRLIHDPVLSPVLDTVFLRIVPQPRFGQMDGADAAQNVAVHIVGSIVHLQVIRGLARHVISHMDQDNIIIFAVIKSLDNLVVEFLDQVVILQLAVPQPQKKLLGTAFLLRLQRKIEIQQIAAQSAGESLFENRKVLEPVILGQREKSLLHLGLDIFFSIYVTSADPGDGTALRGVLPADFRNFFFIHEKAS